MGLQERIQGADVSPTTLVPSMMDTSVNSQGQRSAIAEYTADTALMLRDDKPFYLAVPAYESFTSDGNAGDTETFDLTHSVTDSPATQSAVVWLDGDYYGLPDAVDYDADTIDVTDPNTGSTVHVYYISDAAASVEVRKSVPDATTSSSQQVWTGNAGLVHTQPQMEQPITLDLGRGSLHGYVASDMKVNVYIDAPYTVRFEDPDDDGTEATNAMVNLPAVEASSEIEGLKGAIIGDMGQA